MKVIKTLRQAQRISQAELALKVGVSQNYISWIERGKVKPRSDLLDKLAVVFGVNPRILKSKEDKCPRRR